MAAQSNCLYPVTTPIEGGLNQLLVRLGFVIVPVTTPIEGGLNRSLDHAQPRHLLVTTATEGGLHRQQRGVGVCFVPVTTPIEGGLNSLYAPQYTSMFQ